MSNMTIGRTHRQTSQPPWPLEELVRAQCMACDGHSDDAIAQTLGRSVEDVRRKLDPEPAAGRQEFANVGYRHLKYR
jgi:hypothetical protein